jgi:hypothetical protein
MRLLDFFFLQWLGDCMVFASLRRYRFLLAFLIYNVHALRFLLFDSLAMLIKFAIGTDSPRKVHFFSAICWFVSAKRKTQKHQKKEEKTLPRRHWHVPAVFAFIRPQPTKVEHGCHTRRLIGSFRTFPEAGAAVTTITNTLKSDLVYYP